MGSRDAGQLGVEHAGEGEQVAALVLQGGAHRADAPRVLGFAGCQLGDDEVEQLSPRRHGRAGQGENVVAQPVHERSDVASQPMRLGLGLPRRLQLADKLAVWTPLAGAADPGLQRLAPRHGALGEVLQRAGETFALALDVEHVAVAGRVAPGGLLPGTQALPGVGDGVVGRQARRRHPTRRALCLLVDELAADPVPDGQVADRLRAGQRLNGQVLTVTLGQPRCCANTLDPYFAPQLKA